MRDIPLPTLIKYSTMVTQKATSGLDRMLLEKY